MNYVVDLFLLFNAIVEAKFVLRVVVVVSFPDFVFLFYYAVDLCLLFDFIVAIFSKFVLRVVLVVSFLILCFCFKVEIIGFNSSRK